jgi:histidyl-tRNA synthetase
VFKRLQIPVEIRINNRKILATLAQKCGGANKMMDITIAIDKLDKIGIAKVKEELSDRGLTTSQIGIIENYLSIAGSIEQRFTELETLIGENEGIEELKLLTSLFESSSSCTLVPDFTLARGLNYYTGVIFEVKAMQVEMGSIGGGGRYDDLTGLFGVPNVPGVGISFGLDRIYDVIEELSLFPSNLFTSTKVLFFNLGEKESAVAYGLMQEVRAKNIPAELFHESAKMDKQFKYAEKKNIPYVVIIGDRELQENNCTIKTLSTGKQETLSFQQLVQFPFV